MIIMFYQQKHPLILLMGGHHQGHNTVPRKFENHKTKSPNRVSIITPKLAWVSQASLTLVVQHHQCSSFISIITGLHLPRGI